MRVTGLVRCKSPRMRPKWMLKVKEWPVIRKKRKGRKWMGEVYYRRARRNRAEMERDGWKSRVELDGR